MTWRESDHLSELPGRPSHPLKALLFVAGLALAGILAGCSLIGIGVGAIFDAHHDDPLLLRGWELHRIGIGKRVSLVLRDNRAIQGVFGGLDASPYEYKERYAAWRAAPSNGEAPALGDTVAIETTAGKLRSGEFQGFEYGALSLQRKGHSTADQIAYKQIARASTERGATWDGSRLAGMATTGLLPLRSCMLLDKTRIPLEQVLQVTAPRTHHGKIIGFLVGAVIDALVIISIGNAIGSSYNEPVYYSCPYVYSFEGQRYVREGDVFPGAIFRAAQRSDRLSLEHLPLTAADYRLRLINELQEIEYLDEVKLLVVDGPEGVPVVPVPGGRFRTLTSPLAPVRATDLGGATVLEQVSSRGDEAWAGNPFARDPEHPSRSREGLLLEFPRPANAESVVLVFHAQPTPWASRLMREVLALQGPNLSEWYAGIEADPAAQAEFHRAYRREAQLILRVWSGEAWREAGVINPHEATLLPLVGIPGHALRLRVDSTAGLWSIDSVQADFGVESPVEVVEVSARIARTQKGEDVRSLLESADGRRHSLQPNRSSVDLVFDPPPLKPGRRRSVFLEATGYYTPLVPTTGKENHALFSVLMKEPGGLGHFSQDLAQSELEKRLSPTLSDGNGPDGP